MNVNASLKVWMICLLVLAVIWDGAWKLIALWKSARHGQLAWYVCLAIFNTLGILPIVYLLAFQKNNAQRAAGQS